MLEWETYLNTEILNSKRDVMPPEPTYIIPNTDLFSFLKKASKNRLILSVFWISMFLFLLLFLRVFFKYDISFLSRLKFTFYGFLIALLCIPLHEVIHYCTYKILGARDVKIEMFWKRGYIVTRANKFMVGKKEILPISILPFLTISTAVGIILFFSSSPFSISIAAALLLHGSLCQSDFSILAYFFNDSKTKFMVEQFDENMIQIYVNE